MSIFLDSFIKDVSRHGTLRDALSALQRSNFFAVLFELAATKREAASSDKPLEYAALRAAWHNGYVEAVYDLFNFFELYVNKQDSLPPPDFGAINELYAAKEITKEEYDRLISERAGT